MHESKNGHSLQNRLQLALGRITTDPFLQLILYLMPIAFVDAYGMLYSLGALALLGLMYPGPLAPRQADKRSWLERTTCWVMPAAVLCYQWIVAPRGWATLAIDRVFTLPIDENNLSLLPGFIHLGISYLLPLLIMYLSGSLGGGFRLDRKTLLFTGLIALPVVLRNVFAIEELSGDRPMAYVLALIGLQAFYIPGLGEELLYRGAIFGLLARRLKPAYAVILSSLIFTLAHYNLISTLWTKPELTIPTVFNLAAIWTLGCSTALIYHRTQRLVPCIIFHGMIDGGVRYLFYAALIAMGVSR